MITTKIKSPYIRFLGRPVAVFMFFLGLIFLGLIALTILPVELLPDLAYPRMVLFTKAPGLTAEEIEKEVLQPQESLLSSLPGVRSIEGIAKDDFSLLILSFTRLKSVELTTILIKEKLTSLRSGNSVISKPVILHHDPNAKPVAVIALTSENGSIPELKGLAEEVIVRQLNQLDGVGRVTIEGGSEIYQRYTISDRAFEEFGVTPHQIKSLLETSIDRIGTVREGRNSYSLRLMSGKTDNLSKILIPGTQMALEDAGTWDLETRRDGYTSFNGKQGLALIVEKRYGANTKEVVEDIFKALPHIESSISSDSGKQIKLEVFFHEAGFITDAINSVLSALMLGAFFTLLVLFLSLGSLQQTIAVGISIPVSVISTFLLLYIQGITLNIMSLAGLALGIGMMVDNSIVVSEAIHRHLQNAGSKTTAAFLGVKEVAAPVTASTLTTIAVFLPVLFLRGAVAKLFMDLAIVIAVSLLLSLFVSLTLLPVMLTLFDSTKRKKHRTRSFWLKAEEKYFTTLLRQNRNGSTAIIFFALIFIVSLFLATGLKQELLPDSGKSRVMVYVTADSGKSLDNLITSMNILASSILCDDIESIWLNAGRGTDPRYAFSLPAKDQGYLRIGLEDNTDVDDFIARTNKIILDNPLFGEFNITIKKESNPMEEVLRYSSDKVSVNLMGPDKNALLPVIEKVKASIFSATGLNPAEIAGLNSREIFSVQLNMDLLFSEGISPVIVIDNLRKALSREIAVRDNEVLSVSCSGKDVEGLLDMRIKAGNREYPLSALINITLQKGDSPIYHLNQRRLIELNYPLKASAPETAKIGKILKDLSAELPKDVRVTMGGEAEEMGNSFKNLWFAFILALVIIYMIMAAQFESLLYPFIIITTIPMAAIGVILLFTVFQMSINIMAVIGFTIALGIVINDSIIMTSAMVEIEHEGTPKSESPFIAGKRRFRPIIITSITTIAGMLPMALGTESAARLRSPLAVAVIGGLITATVLTLFIQPFIYFRVNRMRKK